MKYFSELWRGWRLVIVSVLNLKLFSIKEDDVDVEGWFSDGNANQNQNNSGIEL